MEALQQARFANARLADDQHYLPFTLPAALPARHQRAQLVLTSDEWGQSTDCGGGFEPAAHSARSNYLVKLERPFDALQRRRSVILDHEQTRDQPMHSVSDEHSVRFCYRLHPCSNIGSFAEHIRFFTGTRTHHYRTRIDADSCREFRAPRLAAEL